MMTMSRALSSSQANTYYRQEFTNTSANYYSESGDVQGRWCGRFEEYLQARGGGNKPAITTGKMIAAQFEHTASRPDKTNGYAAPQLHTHVVIFNMTVVEDGKARSVQPLELYRSQKYATAIYRA